MKYQQNFHSMHHMEPDTNNKTMGMVQNSSRSSSRNTKYARAWDNDNVLIGHSACPFVGRGGGCSNGSGAGVL